MTYVLDTNIFIAGLNGNAKVLRRLGALTAGIDPGALLIDRLPDDNLTDVRHS